ncbi:ribosomal protection-like ABC-F family protein [Atopococcus tabaci]|uniref:ribosomal protection-like ABC-F family protein n=1 Tax=Atopococcus tabaci TaxID=269774 RepID=UPI002408F66B|nr:ABC-F type ribosomal protection protein [Atopococcus tabaci]
MQELVLELKNIEKSYLNKDVLAIDQLTVYQNERIGIVGKNGQGKSTLLNLIAGTVQPDRGEVHKTVDFQYHRQTSEVSEADLKEIDPALAGKLRVPRHEPTHFSGGEASRFRLAKLFSHYEMGLLMDEPTTHLDEEGIQFLIDELRYYYGTLLVVSHDRRFLDETVEKIWEVADGTVTVYDGNYINYQEQKKHQRMEQERAYEQFMKEKSRLEQAARKKQEQAQKVSQTTKKQKNKHIKPDRLSSSKQKDTVQKAAHKAAKAIEKRAEQLEHVNQVKKEPAIRFPEPTQLEMHNRFPIMGAGVTIQKGEKVLLDEADFQFPLGKRIGITGPNGAGKSSLLEWILMDGEGITLSPKVVFATYRQMDYKLTEQMNLLDYLAGESEYPEPVLRAVLNNLGFSQTEVRKPLSDLSGGESTRLAVAKLFTVPSNVLILDEPTNFIDVQTIEALEELMRSYPGMILFTSHDRYFMRNVAKQIWEIRDKKLVLKDETQ